MSHPKTAEAMVSLFTKEELQALSPKELILLAVLFHRDPPVDFDDPEMAIMERVYQERIRHKMEARTLGAEVCDDCESEDDRLRRPDDETDE